MCDGRDYTAMQAAMGYREIPRAEHEAVLRDAAHAGGKSGRWTAEADLASVANWVTAKSKPDAGQSGLIWHQKTVLGDRRIRK